MIRSLPCLVAAAILLGSAAANAGPANQVTADRDAAGISAASMSTPTDVSARRRHYRYVGNRWRVVRPYQSYGYYGPRPRYYRPYPFYAPFPFGFGFGFNPYYW